MANHTPSQARKNSGNTNVNAESTATNRIDSDLRFFILRPNKTRREWAIQAYTEVVRGQREYHKADTEIFKDLAAKLLPINRDFKAGVISASDVEVMLKDIIQTYRLRGSTRANALKNSKLGKANEKFLNQFWEKRYSHKILADEGAAHDRLKRALRYLGDLSIYTATAREISATLKKNCTTNQHREAAAALNEMLKDAGRDFRLQKPEEEYVQVKYLTQAEVKRLAESAPNHEFKLKTYVLFGTGARTGEAHAIDEDSLGDQAVHITKQLPVKRRRDSPRAKIKKPKRGKQGWVAVISSTWKYVQEWAALDKADMDRGAYYNWLRSRSRALWPNDKSKHIKPHDLRHSHAIHLLDRGFTIQAVARQLRNRVEICQKYYTGHEHTPDSLEALKGKI